MQRSRRKGYFPALALALALAFAFGVVLTALPALAQTWPQKPVRLVVAFNSGTPADVLARAIAEALAPALKQPVVVENRPGAGGTIAAAQVVKADPDGYTFLVHSAGHVINPLLFPMLSYDARDLIGVTPLATLPNVMLTRAGGHKSVQEIVDAGKAAPGKLNYGSTGTGSASHISAEKFMTAAAFGAFHIPFKGAPETLGETRSGRLDFFFSPIEPALQLIRDGKLTPLAVGSAKRSALLLHVPTTIELGFPGSDYNFWIGLFAPAKTPRNIVERLNAEISRVLHWSAIAERFAGVGAEPFTMDAGAFDGYVRSETEPALRIVREALRKAN